MVQRDDQRPVLRCVSELGGQPVGLGPLEVAAGRDVGVDPDERDRLERERPIAVGLGLGVAVVLLVVEGQLRRRRAEVGHERVERLAVGVVAGVAVMVARDADDRELQVTVGLVELRRVLGGIAVEVDDVAHAVDRARLGALLGPCLHGVGDRVLRVGVADAAVIADDQQRGRLGVGDAHVGAAGTARRSLGQRLDAGLGVASVLKLLLRGDR